MAGLEHRWGAICHLLRHCGDDAERFDVCRWEDPVSEVGLGGWMSARHEYKPGHTVLNIMRTVWHFVQMTFQPLGGNFFWVEILVVSKDRGIAIRVWGFHLSNIFKHLLVGSNSFWYRIYRRFTWSKRWNSPPPGSQSNCLHSSFGSHENSVGWRVKVLIC